MKDIEFSFARKLPLLLTLFPTSLLAEENTVSNFVSSIIGPSPQASEIIKYGEYPVSPATGLPNIEIPLYTIECDGIQVPITLSYHASGIKVDDVGSPVGIGWTLNAGGQISRTISSTYDMVWSDEPFLFKDKTDFKSRLSYKNPITELIYNISRGTVGDTESDKYFYQFGNKSGNFRYSLNGTNVVTVPHSTIRIEHFGDEDSIYWKDGKVCIIPLIRTGEDEDLYKITDDDGAVYYFEQTEHSPSPTESYSPITTWYLTKIITPSIKDSIVFSYTYSEYEQEFANESFRFGPSVSIDNKERPDLLSFSSINYMQVDRSFSVSHYKTPLLKSVSWRGNVIDFTYIQDREEAKYENGFCTLPLQKERLSKISITNHAGQTIRHIELEKGILGTSGVKGCRTLLSGVNIYGSSEKNAQKYSFSYDNHTLPEHDAHHSDFWGYYNGSSNSVLWPSKMMDGCPAMNFNGFYGADKHPNEETMQYGTLKSITFPTGGKAVFEYEANRVSADGEIKIWGGLRVKSITRYVDENVCEKEEYSYSDGKTSMPLNATYAGLWGGEFPTYYLSKNIKDFVKFYSSPCYDIQGTGFPRLSMTGWSSNPAFYENVSKKVYDANGSLVRQTDYQYEEDVDNRVTQCYDMRFFPKYYCALYDYDQGNVPPLLISQKDFRFENGMQAEEIFTQNTYELVELPDSLVGVHIALSAEFKCMFSPAIIPSDSTLACFVERNCQSVNVYAVPSFRRLKKSSVTADGITTETTFHYDSELHTLQPTRKEVTRTGGIVHTISYLYPFQSDNSVHLSMYADGHYVDKVVGSQKFLDGQVTSQAQDDYVQKDGMYLLSAKQYAIGGNPLQTRLKVLAYDPFGNIQEVVQDDANYTFFVWGYNHQYPVIKVDCPTECEANVAKVVSQYARSYKTGLEAGSEMTIEMLAYYIKNAGGRVSKFKYKPLVGLIEVMDDKGIKTTYTYDDMNRLSGIYDTNGHLVESYEYNYQNK